MALSEDQKAMLRLLAQREQGYEDIGALTGDGVGEVRAKVREALAGLDGGLSADEAALLRLLAQREEGYADIGALLGVGVDDVRERVRGALGELDSTGAGKLAREPPPPPVPPVPPSPPTSVRPAGPRAAPRLKLPEDKGALRGLVAGGAVVLVIVLLLITGVLGGGGDGSGESTTASAGGGQGARATDAGSATNGKRPTQAVLKAVDGSGASGRALFGRSGQNVLLLLAAKDLPAAPKGQSYTVSLVRSSDERLPLVATEADDSGVISGRFQIAAQVLGLLAGGFDTMELSLVPKADLRRALAQARNAKTAPDYQGTAVLEGPVTGPIVEAGRG